MSQRVRKGKSVHRNANRKNSRWQFFPIEDSLKLRNITSVHFLVFFFLVAGDALLYL